MYTAEQKRFKPGRQQDIDAELAKVSQSGMPVRRVFLADGDAMTLSFRRLKAILESIQATLPAVQRVSAYCLPRNLNNKTVEQLEELASLGLSLLYVGCESGDDEVLERIVKGETFDSSYQALAKIKQAGLKSSVMILNGMGGAMLSKQHAVNSARLMNLAQPDYLATLVVSLPNGEQRIQRGFENQFKMLTQAQLFSEIRLFLETLDLKKTIFRSDHASNYLVLKGVLGKDKAKLLAQVDQAIAHPEQAGLRQEWQRGL